MMLWTKVLVIFVACVSTLRPDTQGFQLFVDLFNEDRVEEREVEICYDVRDEDLGTRVWCYTSDVIVTFLQPFKFVGNTIWNGFQCIDDMVGAVMQRLFKKKESTHPVIVFLKWLGINLEPEEEETFLTRLNTFCENVSELVIENFILVFVMVVFAIYIYLTKSYIDTVIKQFPRKRRFRKLDDDTDGESICYPDMPPIKTISHCVLNDDGLCSICNTKGDILGHNHITDYNDDSIAEALNVPALQLS